ncbi:MAG: hypothetical protein GXY38_07365 [Planctomycetes bacterium]|nr:hypothetical protein [Planctomycetota bacterium]
MCNLCKAALTHTHQGCVDSDDLSGVFIARIKEYGKIANSASKAGDSPLMDRIKSLRQHIRASAHESRVEAEHPVMIGGFFEEFTLFIEYLRIDLFFAGAFTCGLKHILQNTSDVRSVSEEELTRLAQAGQKEAAEIASRTLESITKKSKSVSNDKRWWQFWR